jgi:hypothetical protein
MGRPNTKFETAVAYFERFDTTAEEYLAELSDDELDELYKKLTELESAVLSEKEK